jgi:hypothetical protein
MARVDAESRAGRERLLHTRPKKGVFMPRIVLRLLALAVFVVPAAAFAGRRSRRPALAARRAGRQGRNGIHFLTDRARRAGVDDPRPRQHAVPLGGDRPSARVHGPRGLQRRGESLRLVVHERALGPRHGRGGLARRTDARRAARPGRARDRSCTREGAPLAEAVADDLGATTAT